MNKKVLVFYRLRSLQLLLPDIMVNGYFASTRKEIHGRHRGDIEKMVRIFLKQPNENYMKKQEQ